MSTVVIPFAGAQGKTRLHATPAARRELSLAMLGDVLEAAVAVGETRVVTADPAAAALARDLGADAVDDPGGGQGAAVAAALAGLGGPVLVVNADLPCATSADLRALVAAAPALVEARDGTTNALALLAADAFAPLYGPGSAERFRIHTGAVAAAVDNLAEDVDTLADLERVAPRCGSRTQAVLETLHAQPVP